MSDYILRQDAIKAIENLHDCYNGFSDTYDESTESYTNGLTDAYNLICQLPSVQPEQTKMIEEIRKWINSGNRGSADYFIVDKIEEIINKYE